MLINVPSEFKSGFDLVPAGIYRVVCTAYKTRNSAAGNLCISPEFTIQSNAPDGTNTIGRKVFGNWTLTEAALGVVNTSYKALVGKDLPAGQFEIDEFVARVTSDILNKECLIQVEVKPRQNAPDEFVNDIKRYTAVNG